MKSKNPNVKRQILKAEWAKQKADLARFELVHFQQPQEKKSQKRLSWLANSILTH